MTLPLIRRILLIENDRRLAEATATRLRAAGMQCVTAGSGAQGVALFDKDRIDMVITDMVMPLGDGSSVVLTIRRKSAVPIIVMTGFPELFEQECRGEQGVFLLTKPADVSMLLSCINDAFIATMQPS